MLGGGGSPSGISKNFHHLIISNENSPFQHLFLFLVPLSKPSSTYFKIKILPLPIYIRGKMFFPL